MFVPLWVLSPLVIVWVVTMIVSWDRGRRIEDVKETFRTRCRLAVAAVAMAQADAAAGRPIMAQRRLSHALLKVMDVDSFSDVLDPGVDDGDSTTKEEVA